MSFIQNEPLNKFYQPGWFLASGECTRVTVEVAQNHSQVVTKADGSKYVPAGAVIPSNDGNAKGILYEDVDVTTGAMPGSLVTKGIVYEDRLPASVESTAKAVLGGLTFISSAPAIVRPDYPANLVTLTVQSSAGTAVGDTAITVSGYTKKSSESYLYKVTTGTAPVVVAGEVLSGWTAWDGEDDITAATDKKIGIAVVNAAGEAVAYGSATVTAKANG